MLATLLARSGWNVGVFQPERNSTIRVGESLIPAVIPKLRTLGVEEEVRDYSRVKPGACFHVGEQASLEYPFEEYTDTLPPYAYNVPRNKFDRTLLENAEEEGARIFRFEARLRSENDGDFVFLADETRRKTQGYFQGKPDFIIDATGRTRLLPNLLNLPSEKVGYTDGQALFTHFDRMNETGEGNVHTEIFDRGWAWRIPLPDRVSFGVVAAEEYLRNAGETPGEQLETIRRNVPRLRSVTEGSNRIEPVFSYDNYQLITHRLHGKNWVLLGDTAGFIDPVLSTGMHLSMRSAELLARTLDSKRPLSIGLEEYESHILSVLEKWQEVVNLFYSGRLIALLLAGEDVRESLPGQLINHHVGKRLGRIFLGTLPKSRYSYLLLSFMARYGLKDRDPSNYRIQ